MQTPEYCLRVNYKQKQAEKSNNNDNVNKKKCTCMQCILDVMQVQLHLITSWGPHLQLFNGVLDYQVGLS